MLALQSVQLVTGIDICKYKSAAKKHKISILPCPCLLLNLIPFRYKKIHKKPGKSNGGRYSGMLVNPLTPKMSLVILLTVCQTFNSHSVSLENLVSDQLVIP